MLWLMSDILLVKLHISVIPLCFGNSGLIGAVCFLCVEEPISAIIKPARGVSAHRQAQTAV